MSVDLVGTEGSRVVGNLVQRPVEDCAITAVGNALVPLTSSSDAVPSRKNPEGV